MVIWLVYKIIITMQAIVISLIQYFEADFFYKGVARTLKMLRTSKGDYWIKQSFSSIAPLFKWELLLNERICYQRARILSFKSSSLWYGNPLNVTIFITHVRNCVKGATPMFKSGKLLRIQNSSLFL